MAIVGLNAQSDSFDYGKCNPTKNSNIENSLKQLISCVHLAFIHHVLHVTPHIGVLQTEIR